MSCQEVTVLIGVISLRQKARSMDESLSFEAALIIFCDNVGLL